MKYSIFARGVIGYKNKIKNKKSQDYMCFKEKNDYIIASVADGHGIKRCMFSHRGAEFASKACVEVLEEMYEKIKYLQYQDIEKLINSNDYKHNICKKIHDKWKNYARNHFIQKVPNVYNMDYILYGTTMIGVLITKKFNLYIQIGDGNILEYEDDEFHVVKYKKKSKIRGVINSMYMEDATDYIQVEFKRNNETIKTSVILFSDGYTDSFMNYDTLFNSTKNTINNYNKNIFTRYKILKEYDKYLDYLTINKSKDDISVIYII